MNKALEEYQELQKERAANYSNNLFDMSAFLQKVNTLAENNTDNYALMVSIISDYHSLYSIADIKLRDSVDFNLDVLDTDKLNSLNYFEFGPNAQRSIALATAYVMNGNDYFNLPEYHQANESIATEAVKYGAATFRSLNEKLRDDKKVIIEAIKLDPENIAYTSEKNINDPSIMKIALKEDGTLIKYCNEKAKNDMFLVYTALVDENGNLKSNHSDVLSKVGNNIGKEIDSIGGAERFIKVIKKQEEEVINENSLFVKSVDFIKSIIKKHRDIPTKETNKKIAP